MEACIGDRRLDEILPVVLNRFARRVCCSFLPTDDGSCGALNAYLLCIDSMEGQGLPDEWRNGILQSVFSRVEKSANATGVQAVAARAVQCGERSFSKAFLSCVSTLLRLTG